MTYHKAYRNEHSQPTVNANPAVSDHVVAITALVTKLSLVWKTGTPFEQAAFKRFSDNGFQNEDYAWVVQLAVWLAAHYINNMGSQVDEAIRVSSKKALEVYLAVDYYNNLNNLDVLPPNVKTRTMTLIREVPELLNTVGNAKIILGGQIGALMSYPQQQPYPQPGYPQPQYQPPYPQQGYQQPQYPQQGYPQPQYPQQYSTGYQQPTVDQRYQGVDGRRAFRASASRMPAQQPAYGSYQQPMPPVQAPQGYAPPFPQPASQGSNGHVGQQNYSSAADIRQPANQSPSTVTRPPQGVEVKRGNDWFQPAKEPEAAEPVAQPVVPQVEIPDTLVATSTGYETDYVYPTRFIANTGIIVDSELPRVFDSTEHTGVWKLNRKKEVVSFLLKEKDDMDYGNHNVKQYFPTERSRNSKVDKKLTAKLLADIQKQAYINQELDKLDPIEDDGNVTPADASKKYKLGDPVEVTRILLGDSGETDYTMRAIANSEVSGVTDEMRSTSVINYLHQHLHNLTVFDDLYEKVTALRAASEYTDIIALLDALVSDGGADVLWKFINDTTTTHVNNVLRYRLKSEYVIDSFYLDYEELEVILAEEGEQLSILNSSAKELIHSALYPYDKTDEIFVRAQHGNDVDDKEACFGTLTDVTILPIRSDEINIPVPVPKDATPYELSLVNTAIVSHNSFPELFKAIDYRMKNLHPRVSRVVFTTKDGNLFYVHRAHNDRNYIISSKP